MGGRGRAVRQIETVGGSRYRPNMSSNEASVGGAVSDELTAMLARLGELADAATDPAPDGGAALIDQITVLERMRASLAAAQHTAMVAFARSQVEAQTELVTAGRLDPEKLGRDIGHQIGLAAHTSSWHGSRRLGVARALAAGLSHSRGLLASRRIRA